MLKVKEITKAQYSAYIHMPNSLHNSCIDNIPAEYEAGELTEINQLTINPEDQAAEEIMLAIVGRRRYLITGLNECLDPTEAFGIADVYETLIQSGADA